MKWLNIAGLLFTLTVVPLAVAQSRFSELIPYCKSGKWGFCDTNKTIIIPCRYDRILYISHEKAIVILEGKYGLIDTTGKKIISCRYDRTAPEQNGLFRITLNGIERYINYKGTEYREE